VHYEQTSSNNHVPASPGSRQLGKSAAREAAPSEVRTDRAKQMLTLQRRQQVHDCLAENLKWT
jgi:hypothetical protein